MAELQPAVLFRYENWIHAVSQAESQNEASINVNVAFNGYRYWTLIFSQRATKGNGSRYQDGFVIGMSGGNNDSQNWIAQLEDIDYKLIRRNNFTGVDGSIGSKAWYSSDCYYTQRHNFEDLVTYKFVCDTLNKRMYCYMNQIYLGYGPLNFPTNQYSNGRLEVLKTWAQLGDSNCVSYIGDVWLYGAQTLEDATNYNGGEGEIVSQGKFLVHHSTHSSGRKMASDQSGRMYGWKIKTEYEPPVPPDPENWFPKYSLRLKYADGVTPTFSKGTAVRVSTSPNVWDLKYENANWSSLLKNHTNLLEVMESNTSDVTNMSSMFYGCSHLTSVTSLDTAKVTNMKSMFGSCTRLASVPLMDTRLVTDMSYMLSSCSAITYLPLFDTRSVTNMSYMLSTCIALVHSPIFDTHNVVNFNSMYFDCEALREVPLLDTSSAENMSGMFVYCSYVESGALALYQQASTQWPTSLRDVTGCFYYCGSSTVTGAAELAQIPQSWGGTKS